MRFAAIGINHAHIYGQVDCLLRAGAELVGFHAAEDDLAKPFAAKYPQAPRVADRREIARGPDDRTDPHLRHPRRPRRRSASRRCAHGKD